MHDATALTRRALVALAAAGAVLAAAPLRAQEAQAPEIAEMAMGAEDAPITLIEYASLTCPHCANFQISVMPQIKKEFIDTGKVRLIYREVFFDRPSLWAAMIARCAGEDRYFGVIDLLFRDQNNWARATDAQEMTQDLFAIGRQAGLTDARMQECLQDQAFAEALVAEFQKNVTADGIEATPTFILNGEKVTNMPWPEFQARLNAELEG